MSGTRQPRSAGVFVIAINHPEPVGQTVNLQILHSAARHVKPPSAICSSQANQ